MLMNISSGAQQGVIKMGQATSGFTQGSKYAVISKEFFKEVLGDLERVKTSLTIEDAKVNAEALIEKLRLRYEPKYDVNARIQQADATKLQGSI